MRELLQSVGYNVRMTLFDLGTQKSQKSLKLDKNSKKQKKTTFCIIHSYLWITLKT